MPVEQLAGRRVVTDEPVHASPGCRSLGRRSFGRRARAAAACRAVTRSWCHPHSERSTSGRWSSGPAVWSTSVAGEAHRVEPSTHVQRWPSRSRTAARRAGQSGGSGAERHELAEFTVGALVGGEDEDAGENPVRASRVGCNHRLWTCAAALTQASGRTSQTMPVHTISHSVVVCKYLPLGVVTTPWLPPPCASARGARRSSTTWRSRARCRCGEPSGSAGCSARRRRPCSPCPAWP